MFKGDLMAGAGLVMDTVDILAMGVREERDYAVRYLDGGELKEYIVGATSIKEAGIIAREDLGADAVIKGFRWVK